MELFTYLMAKNDHNTSVKKDLFSYLLGKNQSGTYQEYTGTSLSISNTKKGKMKIDLYGNTSQYTTTGKNKLDLTGITTRTIAAGITITPNFNGNMLQSIKISGTPTATTWQTLKRVTLEAGSYILTGINISDTSKTGLIIGVYIDSSRQYFIKADSTTYSFTLAEQTTMDFVVWVQNVDYYPTGDIYITPMIRLSSVSDTTYEPYTGGASPSPSFSQRVEVVSGDNTIKVEGKNLFDLGTAYHGTINAQGVVGPNESFRTTQYITSSPNTNYYFSTTQIEGQTNKQIYIAYYDNNKTFLSRDSYNDLAHLFTTPNNCYYIRAGAFTANQENVMLELGSTATTYSPYTSSSYQVNLPVKNLYEGSQDFGGVWNNSDQWGTDTNTYNGLVVKKRKGQWNGLSKDIQVESGKTYTFSLYAKSEVARDVGIYISGGTASVTPISADFSTTTEWKRYSITFTCNTSGTIKPRLENKTASDSNLTYICGYQLEVGSKMNSYTPYGTTPIELNKIGTYQDYFYKDSGKWYKKEQVGKATDTSGSTGITINDMVSNGDIYSYYGGSVSGKTITYDSAISGTNTILYQKATATDTQITDTTLINQLEAVYNAKSYNEQTNINQVNDDLPFEMKVKVKVSS